MCLMRSSIPRLKIVNLTKIYMVVTISKSAEIISLDPCIDS